MVWNWYTGVGLGAAIIIAIFSMPQLIKIIKTKNSVAISTAMFVLLVIGDFLFVIQGIGQLANKEMSGLPVLLGNAISCISSSVVLFFKLRNVSDAKKLNISEEQFCANYKENRAKIKARHEADKKYKEAESSDTTTMHGE